MVCKCLWLHNLLCRTAKIPSICSSRVAEPQNQASALKAEICGRSSLQREYQSLLTLLRLHPPDKTCWVKTESTFATTPAPCQNVFYMLMQTVSRPMSLCSHAFRHRFHSEHSFPLKNSDSSPGSGGLSLKLCKAACLPSPDAQPTAGLSTLQAPGQHGGTSMAAQIAKIVFFSPSKSTFYYHIGRFWENPHSSTCVCACIWEESPPNIHMLDGKKISQG